MQDPKTWIDVTNTAITIGLAALIGGGVGIFSSWISSRQLADKEFLKRKHEILENVLQQFDDFVDAQSVYWAELANAVYKRDKKSPDDPLTGADQAKLKKDEGNVWDKYRLFTSCRSRLLLVGEKHAEKVLMKVKNVSDEFFKLANIQNLKCNDAFMEESKTRLKDVRYEFYDAIRDAYVRKS